MVGAAFKIDEETLIPDLLTEFPPARTVLDQYGLRGCGGPKGPSESLGLFARAHDVPIARLLKKIAFVEEPRLLNVFIEAGFTTLASGYARRTMARVVTLRQACRRMAMDEARFVAKLNEVRRRLRSRELPMVTETAECLQSRA